MLQKLQWICHPLERRLLCLPLFSLAVSEQTISPGGKNGGHRHFYEAIFYIVEGQGYEIHDGIRYEWESGDVMCVPTYCIHQHFNLSQDKPARLFFSVPLVFELLGIGKTEQIGLHPDYEVPAGASIIRGNQGEMTGYQAADGLELKLGVDLLYQHKVEAKRALAQIISEPKNKYDHFLRAYPKTVPVGESRGSEAPSGGGLGVSPRYLFFPLSLGKGEGDKGGEGCWIGS